MSTMKIVNEKEGMGGSLPTIDQKPQMNEIDVLNMQQHITHLSVREKSGEESRLTTTTLSIAQTTEENKRKEIMVQKFRENDLMKDEAGYQKEIELRSKVEVEQSKTRKTEFKKRQCDEDKYSSKSRLAAEELVIIKAKKEDEAQTKSVHQKFTSQQVQNVLNAIGSDNEAGVSTVKIPNNIHTTSTFIGKEKGEYRQSKTPKEGRTVKNPEQDFHEFKYGIQHHIMTTLAIIKEDITTFKKLANSASLTQTFFKFSKQIIEILQEVHIADSIEQLNKSKLAYEKLLDTKTTPLYREAVRLRNSQMAVTDVRLTQYPACEN